MLYKLLKMGEVVYLSLNYNIFQDEEVWSSKKLHRIPPTIYNEEDINKMDSELHFKDTISMTSVVSTLYEYF